MANPLTTSFLIICFNGNYLVYAEMFKLFFFPYISIFVYCYRVSEEHIYAAPSFCSALHSKLPRYSTFYPPMNPGYVQFSILRKEDDWVQSKRSGLCTWWIWKYRSYKLPNIHKEISSSFDWLILVQEHLNTDVYI